jgi:transketolase
VQQTGATADIMPLQPLAEKWRAFGWHAQEIDGHNVGEVLAALDQADQIHARPSVIIAHTTKGRGVSFMEYDHRWHGGPGPRALRARQVRACGGPRAMVELAPMRQAYGEALVKLGREHPEVVALTADVQTSDFSYLFGEAFPDRYFNVGIAEMCLVDVAVGLANAGMVPYPNTFAVFMASRAFEPVLTHLAYGAPTPVDGWVQRHPPQMEGAHAPRHHRHRGRGCCPAWPCLTGRRYGDARASATVHDWPGPVYYRFCRNEVPVLFGADDAPRSGRLGRATSDVTLIGSDARRTWRPG